MKLILQTSLVDMGRRRKLEVDNTEVCSDDRRP